jgi:phosphodiesterase/alkaline phosphatase D-like protein
VVVSGVQVLPVAKPLHEKWAHFPHERARLLALFRRLRPKGLVLVSGDVHCA